MHSGTVFAMRDGEWVRFVIRFEVLDVLGAPTTWSNAPIAAVTDAQ